MAHQFRAPPTWLPWSGSLRKPHIRYATSRAQSTELAEQLKRSINYDISTEKLVEALTAASCQEPYSYERLGLLGNVYLKWSVTSNLFLKFPHETQGRLTGLRQSILSRAALRDRALSRGLDQYILLQSWLPIKECEDDKLKKVMQAKRLPDVVEALVGVFFAEKGHTAAKHVMDWLGIHTDCSRLQAEIATKECAMQQCLLEKGDIEALESKLGYRFRTKSLLVEALTHPSRLQTAALSSYGRLAFVGDAVLDYWITAYAFFHYKDLQPGRLTDLRAAAVNNESFCRAAVRHNLHRYLLHGAAELEDQLSLYTHSTANCEDLKAPKVLADVFEAIAGALFVDCNLEIDSCWKIFQPLLQPWVTPETAAIHPVRELNEYCQQHLKCLEWQTFLSAPVGTIEVKAVIDGVLVGSARETQKKMAKKLAAQTALASLRRLECIRRILHQGKSEFNSEVAVKFSRQTLHQICDKKSWSHPDYRNQNQSGPPHARTYTCTAALRVGDLQQVCVGEARPSLNRAKDSAALVLLDALISRNFL